MKFDTKFKFCLLKGYFDKGMGITNYLKYFLAFIFLGNVTSKLQTFIIGASYIIFCFFAGFFWYKYKWIEAEMEVGNRFNLLARELRKSMKKKKV